MVHRSVLLESSLMKAHKLIVSSLKVCRTVGTEPTVMCASACGVRRLGWTLRPAC